MSPAHSFTFHTNYFQSPIFILYPGHHQFSVPVSLISNSKPLNVPLCISFHDLMILLVKEIFIFMVKEPFEIKIKDISSVKYFLNYIFENTILPANFYGLNRLKPQ